MNFAEAMQAAMQGSKLTRGDLWQDTFIYLDFDTKIFLKGDGDFSIYYILTMYDFLATDWEIYEHKNDGEIEDE